MKRSPPGSFRSDSPMDKMSGGAMTKDEMMKDDQMMKSMNFQCCTYYRGNQHQHLHPVWSGAEWSPRCLQQIGRPDLLRRPTRI